MRWYWIHVVLDSNQRKSGPLFPDMASLLVFVVHNDREMVSMKFWWKKLAIFTYLTDLNNHHARWPRHRKWLSLRKMTLLPPSQDCRCVRSGANNAMWNWNDLMEEGTMTRSVLGNDKSWEAGSSVILRRDNHSRWMPRSSSIMILQINRHVNIASFSHHYFMLTISR